MVEDFCALDVDCKSRIKMAIVTNSIVDRIPSRREPSGVNTKKQDYYRYNYYSTQNSFNNEVIRHNMLQLDYL